MNNICPGHCYVGLLFIGHTYLPSSFRLFSSYLFFCYFFFWIVSIIRKASHSLWLSAQHYYLSLTLLQHAYAKNIQCLLPGHHRHGWRHAVSSSCSSHSNKVWLILPSFGFDISSISAIIGTKQYVAYFNNPSGTTQGGIGAALAGGSVIGAIMAGPVSNRIGRRDAIAFACFWWLLGTAIQAGCNGIGMLVAGRFINGICVGITSSQVPVYLVEITKKERRGSIVVIQQWAIEWGIFIMYFAGYGMLLPTHCTCLDAAIYVLVMLSGRLPASARSLEFLEGYCADSRIFTRLLIHRWDELVQDCLGYSIHPMCLSSSWSSVSTEISTLACKGWTP